MEVPISKTQVRIFDDRIEFWNPGILPEGLTVEKLKQTHESKPKNPILAKLFYLIGYVEEVGTGTNKIIEWCLDWNLSEPDFEDTGSSFIVTFKESKLTDEYLETLGLNERQREIINYLKTHKQITSRKYMEIFKLKERTARKDVKELVSKGLLKRMSESDKKAYYILAAIFCR